MLFRNKKLTYVPATILCISISPACSQASYTFYNWLMFTVVHGNKELVKLHVKTLVLLIIACFVPWVCIHLFIMGVIFLDHCVDTCTWQIKGFWLLWRHWWCKVYRSSKQRAPCWARAAGDELHLFTDCLFFHQLGHAVTTAVILCSAIWSQL